MKAKAQLFVLVIFGLISLTLWANDKAEIEPAEITIGERLFLETRFAQAWYAKPGSADSALDNTVTTNSTLRGPFASKTMNCRACHMVDEHSNNSAAGMRSYADFSRRSLIPKREDDNSETTRNSMALVNISIPRDVDTVFHFDGEFNTMEDLVVGTLTGRNYGWMSDESTIAAKHIANIIRNDDGKGELAQEFGGSYQKIFTGDFSDIKSEFRLPAEYRLDVSKATDTEIVLAVSKLISVYVTKLTFSQDEQGQYDASPYDRFLLKNRLPRKPNKGETTAAYSQRLIKTITQLKSPKFINEGEGKFDSHKQSFVFGEKELAGLKLFFAKGSATLRGGNCIACHSAPNFSDFGFHNTSVTQRNYNAIHGQGSFQQLKIPDLRTRNKNYSQFLPATNKHPDGNGRFRHSARQQLPGFADLGLWNVFANPDMPAPQNKLKKIICSQLTKVSVENCKNEKLLPFTIAAFKTPVLRDLGHSEPYMHSGEFINLKDVVNFYITSSTQARNGQILNVAPELKNIHLVTNDNESLVAFLMALNEDYD